MIQALSAVDQGRAISHEKNKVILVDTQGETSVHIEVEITPEGDLLFSGHDIGETPRAFFGNSDYEYWLRIKKKEKDRVLLALLERFYSGNAMVITEMKEFLGSQGIASEFATWS